MLSFVGSVNGAPYGLKLSQVLFSHDNAYPVGGSPPSSVPPLPPAPRPQSCSPGSADDNEIDSANTSSNSLNGNVISRIISRMSCSSMDEDALINSTAPTSSTSSCLSASSIVDSASSQRPVAGEASASASTSTSEGYFCSELVAAFLIATHFIPAHHNPAFFWPDSFAQGKYMDACISQYSDRKNEQSLDVVAVEDAEDEEPAERGGSESSDDSNWEDAINPISGGQRASEGTNRHSTSSKAAVAAATAAAGIGYYGDEFLLDCEVIEVAKAKLLADSTEALHLVPRPSVSDGPDRRSASSATGIAAMDHTRLSKLTQPEDDSDVVLEEVSAPSATFIPTLM